MTFIPIKMIPFKDICLSYPEYVSIEKICGGGEEIVFLGFNENVWEEYREEFSTNKIPFDTGKHEYEVSDGDFTNEIESICVDYQEGFYAHYLPLFAFKTIADNLDLI